jgi:hypothetical protein
MRVVFVMGRGIEGAGVTRYVCEFNAWLNNNGHQSSVIAINEKKWGREKAHNGTEKFMRLGRDKFETAKEYINKHDVVIYSSVPPKKSDPEVIDGFLNTLVKQVSGPKKVFLHIDHLKQSIARNANYYETAEACDMILTYSATSPFSLEFLKRNGQESISKLKLIVNGVDFDELLSNRLPYSSSRKAISYLEKRQIKDDYWNYEKEKLRTVEEKTLYRSNLIQMSSKKLHKTFSL